MLDQDGFGRGYGLREDLETIRNRKWEFAQHLLPPIPLPAAAILLANERRFENHWGTIPTLHTNLEDVELACSYFETFHFSPESEIFWLDSLVVIRIRGILLILNVPGCQGYSKLKACFVDNEFPLLIGTFGLVNHPSVRIFLRLWYIEELVLSLHYATNSDNIWWIQST